MSFRLGGRASGHLFITQGMKAEVTDSSTLQALTSFVDDLLLSYNQQLC